MMDSIYQQATSVRNDFSTVMDKAIYEKPQLISRTKDQLVLVGADMLNTMLQSAIVHVTVEPGDNAKNIYQLEEIPDIFVEADTDEEAFNELANDLLDYAQTFYNDFALYSHAPNRVKHIPYVMRAIALGNTKKVREMIVCQAGKR